MIVMENSRGENVLFLIFSFTGTGLLSNWLTEIFSEIFLSVAAAVFVFEPSEGRCGRDGPALVPSVHCEICFYSDFVHAFVRISTKSNFILLRLYGEMFYIN